MTKWYKLSDVIELLKKIEEDDVWWCKNIEMKYIGLNIDMRDQHCIIQDRYGGFVSFEELKEAVEVEDAE